MRRILLVDDDRSLLRAWRRILRLEGFKVLTAEDGRTGLATAHSNHPDLIITDQSMPGMNGVEFCRLLRRTPTLAAVPAILTSADPVITSEARLWTDFWQKPVLTETMLASITRILADRTHEPNPKAQ